MSNKSKKVFITGVLGGIGSTLAIEFRKQGYFIFGADVRESNNHNCDIFFHFDIHKYCYDSQYKTSWSKKFLNEVNDLDVLINNAAVQKLDSLKDIKLEDWNESLNVNLTGPMLLSQLFFKSLEESNGCIINIGSIHQQLTKPRFVTYATSKSALVGLTKALAVDLEGKVRVNAISPAAIATDMLIDGFDGNKKALDELKDVHPVKRIGYPIEVAKFALFLASENTGFIHGANLTLDGGISSVLKDL